MYSIEKLEKELNKQNSNVFNDYTKCQIEDEYLKKEGISLYIPEEQKEKNGFFVLVKDNNIAKLYVDGTIVSNSKFFDANKISDIINKVNEYGFCIRSSLLVSIFSWNKTAKNFYKGGEIIWKY